MRIYLAGAIADCTDAECKDWRDYAASKLKCEVRNPLRRDYRFEAPEFASDVVEPDKQDIDDCTCILVKYDRPSVGTSMEVLYAWERNKPVFLVAPDGARLSPWLVYHSNVRFSTLDQAIEHLNRAHDFKPGELQLT